MKIRPWRKLANWVQSLLSDTDRNSVLRLTRYTCAIGETHLPTSWLVSQHCQANTASNVTVLHGDKLGVNPEVLWKASQCTVWTIFWYISKWVFVFFTIIVRTLGQLPLASSSFPKYFQLHRNVKQLSLIQTKRKQKVAIYINNGW